jgi:hypothetical protein
MKRLLLIAGLIVTFPIAASAAQRGKEPPIGSRLGSRTVKQEVQDEARAVRNAHEFGRCLVSMREAAAHEFLAAVSPDRTSQSGRKLQKDIHCEQLSGNHLVEGRMVAFPADVFRGMLAEYLLKADSERVAKLPVLPRQQAYQYPWFSGTTRAAAVDEMAACVADVDPSGTMSLLRTEAESGAEKEALGQLTPHLGACLRAGARVHANRQALRAALADALYQRVYNPAPSAVPATGAPR